MDDNRSRLCFIVGGLFLLVLIVYFFTSKGQSEGYSNISDIDNVGSIDSSYDLIHAPEQEVPSSHFADLIDARDHQKLFDPRSDDEKLRPQERLHRLQGDQLLPRVAANVTPYNVDIAHPQAWSYAVNAPRVHLKNRINMLACPYRGDPRITYHPDIALIGKSVHGRDSIRYDGFFSDHFQHLYNKNTGKAYKNMPLKTSSGGTIMDHY